MRNKVYQFILGDLTFEVKHEDVQLAKRDHVLGLAVAPTYKRYSTDIYDGNGYFVFPYTLEVRMVCQQFYQEAMSMMLSSARAFAFDNIHVFSAFVKLLPGAHLARIQHVQFCAPDIDGLVEFEGMEASSLAAFSSLKSIVFTPDDASEQLKEDIALLVAGAFPNQHRNISVKFE